MMLDLHEYTHSAEKARDTTVTTLVDENTSQHVMSVVVTALCKQPETVASDLVTTSHVSCLTEVILYDSPQV